MSAKTWRIALQNSIAATLLLGCNIDTKIVVYDHMLDQQAFAQATSALMKKYGIVSAAK